MVEGLAGLVAVVGGVRPQVRARGCRRIRSIGHGPLADRTVLGDVLSPDIRVCGREVESGRVMACPGCGQVKLPKLPTGVLVLGRNPNPPGRGAGTPFPRPGSWLGKGGLSSP